MRSAEQAAKESTLRPPYMTRTEFESIALPLLAARDREWNAELTALREQLAAAENDNLAIRASIAAHRFADAELEKQLAAVTAERDAAREERERLRHLAYRQEREIGDLQCMADSVEALRRIGNVVGCGHVDDPDGRRCLVACVEQVLTKAESRASAAEAEAVAMREALAWAVEQLEKLAHLCPDGSWWATARTYGYELAGFGRRLDACHNALSGQAGAEHGDAMGNEPV